jgi:hypothetical protein
MKAPPLFLPQIKRRSKTLLTSSKRVRVLTSYWMMILNNWQQPILKHNFYVDILDGTYILCQVEAYVSVGNSRVCRVYIWNHTKRPRRTKASPSQVKTVVVTGPGDCVSVDQLESSTPVFVAQLKGILTKRRYTCATVFVDHYSRLGYVHMQQQLTSDETVEAKHAFEAFSRSQGVTIKHNHADNGIFDDNAFLKDIREAIPSHSITYFNVNAHFQNGIAEKRIRYLQEPARKQLLHAKARWPAEVTTNLWPYDDHHLSSLITCSVKVFYDYYELNN